MIYSQKELSQLLVEYCAAYDIEHVIISPGSRNAPLTIGFTNHPKIKTYSIVDERCAAFFALGIAQQTKKPSVVVCTSGSAVLNYYPAVAEAFYSDIPLIVISADRPKHLIDIGDGQTIRQENILEKHSLYNANLIEGKKYRGDNSTKISEAIRIAVDKKGPVHINVPFDEPLYETTDKSSIQDVIFKKKIPKIESDYDLKEIVSIWNTSQKKLILVGTHFPDIELQEVLSELANDESVLIFTETTSNLDDKRFINSIDKLIFQFDGNDFKELQPDILITIDGMVVSKKIKQFLRNYQPKHHWHIDEKNAPDTYHCLTRHFKANASLFLKNFLKVVKPAKSGYQEFWLELKKVRNERHHQFLSKAKFSDLKTFEILLGSVPDNCLLQLGNSSIVRYSQLFDINPSPTIFCNRGTSGIDGCTSTALGAARVINDQTIFITGDISFFYDSNALWNNYIKNDFRIILINNSGGGVFKIIPGPKSSNVLDYLETPHDLTAKNLCNMYGFEYKEAKNESELQKELTIFYQKSDHPKLLEVFTPSSLNDIVLKEYFDFL